MDNSFTGQKTVSLTETLACVSKDINRKLSYLEHSIVALLHNRYHTSIDRFVTDEDNDLMAYETNEDAGIVELTEDYACAFKSEMIQAQLPKDLSLLFPKMASQMYQNLLVCGAQPLSALLSLSFGTPPNAFAREGISEAIRNISLYNNTYGISLVGGDMKFGEPGQQTVTTGFMTVGLIDKNARLNQACVGKDNLVYMVGASAIDKRFQSEAFAAREAYELVSDLHREGTIVAIQNVGKNGIIGACLDMVMDGINGMELCFDSLICEPGNFQNLLQYIPDKIIIIVRNECSKDVEEACRRWDKQWIQIGTVIEAHQVSIMHHQKNIVCLPAATLAGIQGKTKKITVVKTTTPDREHTINEVPEPDNYPEVTRFMLTSPNLLSQKWIFEQFDNTIVTNNLGTNYISDASVIPIKDSRHAIALSYCNNTYNLHKYPEAVNMVVIEAVRKVICTGGVPRTLTGSIGYSAEAENCLVTMNQDIALTCQKLGIASSGVQINHNNGKKTPDVNLSIGTIAFLSDKHQQMTMSFKDKGDMIYMLGKYTNCLDSSEYIRVYHNIKDTPPPTFDMDEEVKLLRIVKKVIARQLVKSAHCVSRGGLFMNLLESAMVCGFGFDITTDDEIRKDAFLFGESPSRIIMSIASERETDFIDFMMDAEIPLLTLGHVTREEIRIDDTSYGFINDYKKQYFGIK